MATKTINLQLKRIAILFTFVSLVSMGLFAQPNWVPGTPDPNPTALYLDLEYGLDVEGEIYGFIINYEYTTVLTPDQVKSISQSAVNSGRISNINESVSAGEVNTIKTVLVNNQYGGDIDLIPNRTYTLYLVAEDDATGTLTSVYRQVITTPSCPSISVGKQLFNNDVCVNGDGATKIFRTTVSDGVSSGLLKGATWTIDWGDGTPAYIFYTSTATDDGPGDLVPGFGQIGDIQHTYTTHSDCYYPIGFTIENPGACASTGIQTSTESPILHGRDTDADGNGEMLLVNDATNSPDTIKVCEFNETQIVLRDDGTWDCDAVYRAYPPSEPNTTSRNVQFVYGMNH
jgi:hypothetical protein